ncbi:hypothetical protein SAMD00019534_033340 [Acytostelium subglobosum LB1]|uniref:hypothetical protein n=1 Tax=Acytostelium subglobosum LB1 TaxID=1410327 RepID=UPI000644C626|nr:hypothetical protein SAMD00019534_033340 [Acytostelium subglobosum LB1]GAM20159.1 hypothetical protein SAMD00019534_033340 [Acytostelium subglobosum LB1]|eukprot:XP_012759680.1 hypothetical protein SAMD00019534_033340 [Acytostelium subglobosum LB1]
MSLSITNPKNFDEWIKVTQELTQIMIDEKALVDTSRFPYTRDNSIDNDVMLKVLVVGLVSNIPGVGSPFGVVIDAIWSNAQAQGSAPALLYDGFRIITKNMINEALENDDLEDCTAEINKITTAMTDFFPVYNKWLLKPHKKGLRDSCKAHFATVEFATNSIIQRDGSALRKPTYGVTELGMFTVAATTEILLLKEVIKNGKAWGYTNIDMKGFKDKLAAYPRDFMDYAIRTYKHGVQLIKDRTAENGLPGWMAFNKVLKFRSYCARFVFDYMDLWSLSDSKLFPEGTSYMNPRYCFHELVGAPVLENRDVSIGDSDYYKTLSYDALESWFNDSNRDQFQKELKQIMITIDPQHPPGFLKSIQTTYRDPAYPNSERVETEVGADPVPNKSNVYKFLPHAATESFSYGFGVVPRQLGFSTKTVISTTFPTTSLDLGVTWHDGEYYDFYAHPTNNQDPNLNAYGVPATIPNHKLGVIAGHTTNWEIVTNYYKSEPFQNPNIIRDGVIDAVLVGMVPSNTFNENYIMPKVCTMIAVSKLASKSGAVFARDHLMPTVHSMRVPDGSSISFRFQPFEDTTRAFMLGVRYFTTALTGTVKLEVLNNSKKAGELLGDFELEQCSMSSDKSIPYYNTLQDKTIMITLKPRATAFADLALYSFKAVGGEVYVNAIAFWPAPTQPPAVPKPPTGKTAPTTKEVPSA